MTTALNAGLRLASARPTAGSTEARYIAARSAASRFKPPCSAASRLTAPPLRRVALHGPPLRRVALRAPSLGLLELHRASCRSRWYAAPGLVPVAVCGRRTATSGQHPSAAVKVAQAVEGAKAARLFFTDVLHFPGPGHDGQQRGRKEDVHLHCHALREIREDPQSPLPHSSHRHGDSQVVLVKVQALPPWIGVNN